MLCSWPTKCQRRLEAGELGGLRLRLLVTVLADVAHAELRQFGTSDAGWNFVTTIVVMSPVPRARPPRGIRDARAATGETVGEVAQASPPVASALT